MAPSTAPPARRPMRIDGPPDRARPAAARRSRPRCRGRCRSRRPRPPNMHPLDQRGRQQEVEERVDRRGSPGSAVARLKADGVHRGQQQREEDGREPDRRLAQRGQDRAAGQDPDLGDRLLRGTRRPRRRDRRRGVSAHGATCGRVLGPFEATTGGVGEDVVQRRLVQLEVLDPDAGCVEGPDHVGHLRRPARAGRCTRPPSWSGRASPMPTRAARARSSSPAGTSTCRRRGADGGLQLVGAALLARSGRGR